MREHPEWNEWSTAFKKRLRNHMARQNMNQKNLAAALGMKESSLSTQLNRSMKPWLVEAVAGLWPEEFGDDAVNARRAYLGFPPDISMAVSHLKDLLNYYLEATATLEKGIATTRSLIAAEERRMALLRKRLQP